MPNFSILIVVALGGALGAVSRYIVSYQLIGPATVGMFPWGTFAVNVAGSLLIGACIILIGHLLDNDEPTRLLVVFGFLGAFTTFSTFSFETWQMLVHGHNRLAAIYISSSLFFCLLATALGILVTNYLYNQFHT